MSAEEITSPVLDSRTARHATGIVLLSLAIGGLTQLLFFDTGIGLNVPLEITALLLAGWLLRARGRGPRLQDAWLPFASVLLATFVALRGDPTLAVLDVLAALALAGLSFISFAGWPVVAQPAERILVRGWRLLGVAAGGAAVPLRQIRLQLVGQRVRTTRPVLRGLLIALPLVAIFATFFSSADAVFGSVTGRMLSLQLDLGSIPGRIAVSLAGAWVAAGLMAFVAAADASAAIDLEGWRRRPRLGSTEAVTVIVILDLLFAAFAVLQAAYLFGGLDTMQASGLTYAEYARRGFFELLAVAVLVGALIVSLELFVASRTRAYLAASIGLVALTGVVLASAFLRLRLYQDAYGWTELRFYVLAAILWLGIGAVAGVTALLANRTPWLFHGMVAVSIAFGIGFNLLGPVRYVAEQNVARAIHPSLVPPGGEAGMDPGYLARLGTDAVIVLAQALPDLPPATRAEVTDLLVGPVTSDLAHPPPWQAWSLSAQRARDMLLR